MSVCTLRNRERFRKTSWNPLGTRTYSSGARFANYTISYRPSTQKQTAQASVRRGQPTEMEMTDRMMQEEDWIVWSPFRPSVTAVWADVVWAETSRIANETFSIKT